MNTRIPKRNIDYHRPFPFSDDPDPFLTGREEFQEILDGLKKAVDDLTRRIEVMEGQVKRGKELGNPLFGPARQQ